MSRINEYIQELQNLPEEEWEAYLMANSGLPGPRGNLELAQAVADLGSQKFFADCLRYDSTIAPTNNPTEFVYFCGILGQGRLIAGGDHSLLAIVHQAASDPRWRVREAAAMALQRVGKQDINQLIEIAKLWLSGTWLEKRLMVAALAEPALLKNRDHVLCVLDVLDEITASLEQVNDRKDDGFQALRKTLGYAWSVVVAALPEEGKERMERWFSSQDRDVRWVMKENLKKKRLERALPVWTKSWRER